MQGTSQGPEINLFRSGAWRAIGFFTFWLVLTGSDRADLPAGVLATVLAVWSSLHLAPPSGEQLNALRCARFIVQFVRQAIKAGIDVALRALGPQLRIRPGFVRYRSRLPPGAKRDAFCTETTLLPGTLPCGEADDGALLIHCLDTSQPVPEQLAEEEARFIQLFKIKARS